MSAYLQHTINCKGTLLDLSSPKVMGILNTTPDSFYDGNLYTDPKKAITQVKKMLKNGADIIDVGGYSSRPGADDVPLEEEITRTSPLIEILVNEFEDILVSIDTFRSEVASEAVKSGACIVNDISAGEDDENMINVVSKLGVPYIAMHKKGLPKTMQQNPTYNNVVQEVFQFLAEIIKKCNQAGIKDVIIDPGFGFGKTLEHNLTLMHNLSQFNLLEVPMLVGISRKSMIKMALGELYTDALNGTTILNTMALQSGANIIRVHDVKEAKECVVMLEKIRKSKTI